MPLFAWLLVLALSVAGCRSGLEFDGLDNVAPTVVDQGRPFDYAVPLPDLWTDSPPDFGVPPPPPDFSVLPLPDIALPPPPPDIAFVRDLVEPWQPDLLVRDFTVPPDVRLPDLVTLPDLSSAYPAPHMALPQVVNAGGPRLINPRLYSVTFNGDAAAAALDAYVAALPKSAWWTAVMTDYGVGAGTVANAIHLAENAPNRIDDAAVQTWLAGKLDGTHPEFGQPDKNSLYILEYPSTTTITMQGAASCQQFGGYHSSTVLGNGQYVAYAVIARCRADALNPNLTLNQVAAVTISHEVAEAASDATPLVQPAYSTVDVNSQGWELAGGGETADLCVLLPGNVIFPNDLPLPAARSWSNSAAKKDQDPCVPAPQGVTYFNSAPVLNQRIFDPYQGTNTLGVRLAVGATTSIELDLFSSGPTGAWTVTPVDVLTLGGGQPYLTLSLNKNSGVNGDKLTLTITRNRQGPLGFEPILIRNTLNGYSTHWQIGVATR